MSNSNANHSDFSSSAQAYLPTANESPLTPVFDDGKSSGWRETRAFTAASSIYSPSDSPFSGGEHEIDWKDEEVEHEQTYEIREDVLNARLRAKAAATTTTTKQQHRQRDGVLRSETRKSLLDPSAFGFDAQNGDPRIIMAERGNDLHPLPPSQTFDAHGRRSTNVAARDDEEAHVELITVPALGAEYTSEELRALRREKRASKTYGERKRRCARWFHGDSLVCGCIAPRVLVFLCFFFVCGLGVLLYFVIPRVPSFAVNTMEPLIAVPNGASMLTHHAPTNFSMRINVNLRADNTQAWVATRAKSITLNVVDLSTVRRVGQGSLSDCTFPGQTKSPFLFPVNFAYASVNVTGDQTWAHWINACGPKYDNTPRQSLNLQFTLQMKIAGLLGTRGTSVQLSNLACPFTLQAEQT